MPDYSSFTQIDTYLNCPTKFKFRYKDKIRIPTVSPERTMGSSVHAIVADLLTQKMTTKDPTPKQRTEIISAGTTEFKKTIRTQIREFNKNAKTDEQYDESQISIVELATYHERILEYWCKDLFPEIHPVSVEEKREIELGGEKFIMYIDLVQKLRGGHKRILDWKVTKAKKSKNVADNSLQLSIYALGTGVNNVGFGSLVRPRKTPKNLAKWTPTIDVVSSRRTKSELDWAVSVVESTLQAIREERFPLCSPENFLCNAKYCDFWKLCRGASKAEEPQWLQEIMGEW